MSTTIYCIRRVSVDKQYGIAGSDWILVLEGEEGDSISNFTARREGGQTYRATMIIDTNDQGRAFRQLFFFEHDRGDKVGDVVLVFRQHPKTKRYMVQVEQEKVFVTEQEVIKIWRATRASVDNSAQAVKRTVAHSGWIYSNPRRIGGKPIKTHYLLAGWSPQLAGEMMDVYDYVQTLDGMGLATFLKALQHMPDQPARAFFDQMRNPSADEE